MIEDALMAMTNALAALDAAGASLAACYLQQAIDLAEAELLTRATVNAHAGLQAFNRNI